MEDQLRRLCLHSIDEYMNFVSKTSVSNEFFSVSISRFVTLRYNRYVGTFVCIHNNIQYTHTHTHMEEIVVDDARSRVFNI